MHDCAVCNADRQTVGDLLCVEACALKNFSRFENFESALVPFPFRNCVGLPDHCVISWRTNSELSIIGADTYCQKTFQNESLRAIKKRFFNRLKIRFSFRLGEIPCRRWWLQKNKNTKTKKGDRLAALGKLPNRQLTKLSIWPSI